MSHTTEKGYAEAYPFSVVNDTGEFEKEAAERGEPKAKAHEGKNDPFGSFFRRGSRIPRVSEKK